MSNRKFRFHGVSKVDGRLALRASNRETYDQILKRDKNTAINIKKFAKPMTKAEAREALAKMKEFQTPAILKLLKRGEEEAPPARKKRAADKAA